MIQRTSGWHLHASMTCRRSLLQDIHRAENQADNLRSDLVQQSHGNLWMVGAKAQLVSSMRVG
jgi:hypothetical protein